MAFKEFLLIVLSVIIVGAAVAIGLKMFVDQSYSTNKSACAAEMRLYTKQLIGFWNNSVELGGAGYLNANVTVAKVKTFLAFNEANNSYKSANGEFRVISCVSAGGVVTVTLKALGTSKKANKYPLVTTTISFNQSVNTPPPVVTTLGSATSF